MKRKIIRYSFILSLIIFTACKVGYSFTGANIAADVKTVSVDYFPNHALLVNPNLSQSFTEDLKDKFVNQTSLELVSQDGDLQFSGEIISYKTSPAAIQGDLASQTRLTIAIAVQFVNTKDSEQDFEKTFTGYSDFPSEKSLNEVEDEAAGEIIEKIINDVFNASVSNW